jgi:hypothetical protein
LQALAAALHGKLASRIALAPEAEAAPWESEVGSRKSEVGRRA